MIDFHSECRILTEKFTELSKLDMSSAHPSIQDQHNLELEQLADQIQSMTDEYVKKLNTR